VVERGTPEQIARNPKSYTGQYLKPVLARKAAKGRRTAAE
jgi:excinuclease ABC subunit A